MWWAESALLLWWEGGQITTSHPPHPGSDGPGSYYYQKSCYTTSQIELLLYSIQRFTAGKFPSSSKHRKRSVSNPSLSRALSTSLDHNFLVYYPISSSLDIDSRYQGIFLICHGQFWHLCFLFELIDRPLSGLNVSRQSSQMYGKSEFCYQKPQRLLRWSLQVC